RSAWGAESTVRIAARSGPRQPSNETSDRRDGMGRRRGIFGGASGSGSLIAPTILMAACLSVACGDVTKTESGEVEQTVGALTAPELKGAVLLNGNGQYNRCIKQVSTSFASLYAPSRKTAAYFSKGGQRLPPYN